VTVHDHPTNGRLLTCICCAGLVRVYEIPKPFIDPARFSCDQCLRGDIAIRLEEREQTIRHDPGMAALPEGY
jgi:hypothetical protein